MATDPIKDLLDAVVLAMREQADELTARFQEKLDALETRFAVKLEDAVQNQRAERDAKLGFIDRLGQEADEEMRQLLDDLLAGEAHATTGIPRLVKGTARIPSAAIIDTLTYLRTGGAQ